jgi:phosphoribosylformylglycinamidine synthase
MKSAIIVFPGTNRERDMAQAIRSVTGQNPDYIWHKQTSLSAYDLIILPGGFSYGDYLRCGAMAAHSPIMKEVMAHAKKGTPILGVCNGFQMLVETNLLPGALIRNKSLKFICRQVHLKSCASKPPFMSKFSNTVIKVPVAHGEGCYYADSSTLQMLEQDQRIAFQYCNENGEITDESNPNGSALNIAGILNKRSTILGMMPHPENATLEWQDNQSGCLLFENILERIG